MAIIEGGTTGSLQEVGAASSLPAHVTCHHHPYGSGGVYRMGMSSGTIGAALAANSEVFQFRYVTSASRICLVHRVTASASAILAATAAQATALRMTVARSWSAAGSGGTRATLTGNNCKERTSMATSEVSDAGISSTAALTAGTKTLDTTDLAAVMMGIGTGALTVAINTILLPYTQLFGAQDGAGHPLVLANQEGFVLRTGLIWPATMTWSLSVNVVWSEVPAY